MVDAAMHLPGTIKAMPAQNAAPPKIIAIMPAHNEAARIQPVVRSVLAFLPALVIDDGSSDQTAALAEEVGAQVVRQWPNAGKGAALRAGFGCAIQCGCDAVITLDSDGQHNPADIPSFIDLFRHAQPDLIIGYRNFKQMPFARRLANTFGRLAFSWALGQYIRDNQSGYRLLSQRMMKATLLSQEQGFEFEIEMIKICIQNKFTLAWAPIETIYAGESSHIKPILHVRNFVYQVWRTRQMRKEQ